MDSSGKSRLVVFNSEGIAGLLARRGFVPGRTLAPSAKQQLTSFEERHGGEDQKNHETDLAIKAAVPARLPKPRNAAMSEMMRKTMA
jgi:hypothetical protein